MGFLTAVTGILDSTGKRVDPARTDGTFLPVQIKLDSTLDYTATNDGRTTTVLLKVASSSSVSSYIKPTGGSGTEGVSVGRYDIDPTNGAFPGTFEIQSATAGVPALSIDNTGLTFNFYGAYAVGIGGDTTIGGALTVTNAAAAQNLSLNTAPADLATLGTINLGTDGTHLQVRPDGTAAHTVWDSSQTIPAGNGGTGQSSYAPGTSTQLLHGGTTPSWSAVSLSADVSGTLPTGNGGTGLTSWTAGDLPYYASGTALSKLAAGASSQVLIGGTTPSWGSVALASMVSGTLPATSGGTGQSTTSAGDLLYGAGSNTWAKLATGGTATVLHGGSVPSWSAVDLTADVTGTLPAGGGGTGNASYAVGDILYASGTTVLSRLADVATGNALISGGVTTAPSWGKIGLTTHVSGTLPVANGGTNLASYTAGDLLYASGSTTLAKLADVATGQVLISGGVGVAPAWSASPTLTSLTLTSLTLNGSAYPGQIVQRNGKSNTDATATTTLGETTAQGLFYTPAAQLIDIILRNEGTAISPDNSNYASLIVTIHDSSTNAVIATYTATTQSTGTGALGSVTAWSVRKFSTLTGMTFPTSYASSNYVFTFQITKTGSGVITGPLSVFVIYIP